MSDTDKSIPVTENSSDPLDRLRSAVRAAWGGLTPAERAVCQFLIDCPAEQLLFSSAQELGAASGTSNASVVRTVRRIGYPGLPGLKREVAAAFTSEVPPDVRLHQRIANAGHDLRAIRERVFGESIERLEQCGQLIDDRAFADAVALLGGAGEVLAYAVGASEPAGRHLALKLNRMGRRARFVGATGFGLADALLPLTHGDVVVVFAPGRLLHDIEVLLDRARAVGARRIVITDELMEPLADRVDVAICAPHTPTGSTAEALTGIVVCDALLLALASVAEDRAVDASHALTELRRRLLE